jgi:filamentous hemagglutinin
MRTRGFAVLTRTKGWRLRLIALLTLAAFAGHPAVAGAQVVSDPNAGSNRPRIDVTANGLPLVQITNPSAAGVSRNMYGQFNVEERGLVFNNSLTLTQTQLAGYVAANPNLKSSARLILNEVTGAEASRLGGYMEVAGAKADVVIANQNGITCNGCGFINAGRGTLTTGTPVFGGAGTLDALRVTGGEITVQGLGLNADNIDRLDLVSRTLKLNAGVWAKELSAVTGASQVGYGDSSVTPLSPVGAAPAVSLDVGALGGMYAGKIRLVGTEQGVGVVSRGKLASAGEFTLTSEGNILLTGSTSSGGAMAIGTSGAVENRGTLYSAGGLWVDAGGALANTSTIAAQGQLQLTADMVRTSGTLAAGVAPDGKVAQASHLVVTAANGLDAAGQLMAGGVVSLDAGAMSLAGASVQSGGDTYLTARNGGIAAAGWKAQAGGNLLVEASGGFDGTGGSVLAGNVQIRAGSIDLGRAQVRSVGDTVLVARSGGVGSAGGLLQAGGALAVQAAGAFGGADGQLLARDIQIEAASIDVAGARLRSTGSAFLSAESGGIAARNGAMQAGGNLVLSAAGALDGSGASFLGENLGIEAASIDLTSGNARAAADMSLESTSGGITSRGGTVQANGNVVATSAGAFDNTGGTAQGRSVQITADSIQTGTLSAGVTPDGTPVPDGHLFLDAANGVEASGQRLTAGGIVSIEAGSMNVAGATVQSGDDTYLTARRGDIGAAGTNVRAGGDLLVGATGSLAGTNALLHADDVQILAGSIELGSAQVRSASNTLIEARNGGIGAGAALLQAGGRLELTAQGAFAGAQARISGVGDDLDVNRAPELNGVPDVNGVSIKGTSVDLTGANVQSGGNAWIEATAGDIAEHGAEVRASGALTVRANAGALGNGGTLVGTDVDISVARTIDLAGSSIGATRDLTLAVTGGDVINTGNTLVANGNLAVSAAGVFDNTGGTVMGANVTIAADDIRQEGAASLIAATESVGLFPRNSLLNKDGAWIFSLGSILIAGAEPGTNGELVKAGSVINSSAKIEADVDLTIAAVEIRNQRSIFRGRGAIRTEDLEKSQRFGSTMVGPLLEARWAVSDASGRRSVRGHL